MRRMIVKGSLHQLVEDGRCCRIVCAPHADADLLGYLSAERKCHNAEVIHKLRKRCICPGLDCPLHTSTQQHMPALRLLLTFGMALAIGIANASACTDKPTMLDRVSCEHRKFMATVRATPYPDLVYRYGVHRKALAADLDDRKITPQQFEARELELSSGLANALIGREDQRRARRASAEACSSRCRAAGHDRGPQALLACLGSAVPAGSVWKGTDELCACLCAAAATSMTAAP